MRLGLSTYTFSWSIGVQGKEPPERLDAFGLLRIAIDHGLKCVQIADNLPLNELTNEQCGQLKKMADDSGITIETGTRGLMPENIKSYLDIAEYFRSPILRAVIDAGDFKPDVAEIKSIISELTPEFEKRKITLAIENHDRLKVSEFHDIITSAASPRIGICLDSVNSMGAGEGFEEVFRILGPYTVNLHIKDYIIKRIWHMMGFIIEGMPAGRGILPIPALINKLENLGRCRSGILELWTPQQDTIRDTVNLEKAWAVESIEYLRKFFSN